MGIADIPLSFGGGNIVEGMPVTQHGNLCTLAQLPAGGEGDGRAGMHDGVVLADIRRIGAGL